MRVTVAGVVLVAAWPLTGGPRPVPVPALAGLVVSPLVGLFVGDSLYFEAVRRIGAARALPISMASPLLTTVLAVALLGEALALPAWVGIALTLGGVYLVAVPRGGQPGAGETEPTAWSGVVFAGLSAALWSVSTLVLRSALDLVDPGTANVVRIPVASAMLWAFAWGRGLVPADPGQRRRALVVGGGIGLLSAGSNALFVLAIADAGAARASVLSNTTPLFVVPAAVLLLGERGSWRLVVGTVLSVLGIAVLTLSRGT